MKGLFRTGGLNSRGQASIQLVFSLVLVFALLVGLAFILPTLSPTKTLALAAGMVVFIISFVSTEIGLYVLIFSMLLSPEFIVGTTEGAALERGVTLRMDDFLLVIIGFSWLARMSINKELGLFLRTPLNKPIAYYIIICLVSTLYGVIFGRVELITGFFFVLKYFEYVIVYFIVANHLENRKQVRNYFWAMLSICAIVSIIGIAQIPGGGRVSAPFEGEVGEPNTFGGYLVFMISLAAGMLLTSPSVRQQLVYGFLIVLSAVPLFYTQSRSSYLAAVPAVIAFVLLSKRKAWMVLGVLLVTLCLPLIAPNPAKERVLYTFNQGRQRSDVVEVWGMKLDTSTSARILSWVEASRDWVRHPVLGFGVTGYRFVDAQYVRVITETGLLGLFFFFALAVTIFRQAYRVFRESSEPLERGLSMGFLAGFAGLLFHGLGANTFIIVRIMEPFWFVAAMVIMMPDLKAGVQTPAGKGPKVLRQPGGQ